jgi:hypothetical protein
LTGSREPQVRWVVPEDLTEERIEEARERHRDLARGLGRISARVCHDMGIQFDMDDPDIAREVIKMTFEALFLSEPRPRRSARRSKEKAD